MALTTTGLRRIVQSEKLFRETVKDTFWLPRFGGIGPSSMIQIVTDLQKGSGATVTFALAARLKGAGITGSSGKDLDGNEENLDTSNSVSLVIDEHAHAVMTKGPMEVQASAFPLLPIMRERLLNFGREKIDQLIWDAAYAGGPNNRIYASGSTVDSLTSANKMTSELLSNTKAAVMDRTNLLTVGPMKPVMVRGTAHFVAVLSTRSWNDLKQSTTWRTDLRNAAPRSMDNPIFTGMEGVTTDNVIVFQHENVVVGSNASGVNFSRDLFLGANALGWGWGQRPVLIPVTKDLGNRKRGFAWGLIGGAKRIEFNSQDAGMVEMTVATTKPTLS